MAEKLDAERQVKDMLAKGWTWSASDPDVLLHPANHTFRVRFDRTAGTLAASPELVRHLDLIIPTPASQSKVFLK